MTSKNRQSAGLLTGFIAFPVGLERSAARLTLGSMDLPFLLAANDAGCLDFPGQPEMR